MSGSIQLINQPTLLGRGSLLMSPLIESHVSPSQSTFRLAGKADGVSIQKLALTTPDSLLPWK